MIAHRCSVKLLQVERERDGIFSIRFISEDLVGILYL